MRKTNSTVRNEGYKERCEKQLSEWAKGNSVHNDVDDECCPDFSCCDKNINTPIAQRKQFRKFFKEQGADACATMLGEFLGSTLKNAGLSNFKIITGVEGKN